MQVENLNLYPSLVVGRSKKIQYICIVLAFYCTISTHANYWNSNMSETTKDLESNTLVIVNHPFEGFSGIAKQLPDEYTQSTLLQTHNRSISTSRSKINDLSGRPVHLVANSCNLISEVHLSEYFQQTHVNFIEYFSDPANSFMAFLSKLNNDQRLLFINSYPSLSPFITDRNALIELVGYLSSNPLPVPCLITSDHLNDLLSQDEGSAADLFRQLLSLKGEEAARWFYRHLNLSNCLNRASTEEILNLFTASHADILLSILIDELLSNGKDKSNNVFDLLAEDTQLAVKDQFSLLFNQVQQLSNQRNSLEKQLDSLFWLEMIAGKVLTSLEVKQKIRNHPFTSISLGPFILAGLILSLAASLLLALAGAVPALAGCVLKKRVAEPIEEELALIESQRGASAEKIMSLQHHSFFSNRSPGSELETSKETIIISAESEDDLFNEEPAFT